MLPIWFKYLDPIIKKIKNKFWENRKFEIKQKRIGPIKKRIFDPPSYTKKTKKMITLRLKSTGYKLRSRRMHTHTHTHTYIQTLFKNHVFWFLRPQKTIITCFYNNSKNYYHKASSRRKQLYITTVLVLKYSDILQVETLLTEFNDMYYVLALSQKHTD